MPDDLDKLFEPTEEDLNRVGLSKKPWHTSAADFPFDPALRIEEQIDLDRLRCISDRAMAQTMYESFMRLQSWWGTEDAERSRERQQRKKENAELTRIRSLADRSFKGDFGLRAKSVAVRILFPEGYMPLKLSELPALREFEAELMKLRRPKT